VIHKHAPHCTRRDGQRMRAVRPPRTLDVDQPKLRLVHQVRRLQPMTCERRRTRTSWQPGRSGNPGGRPRKTPEQRGVQELARRYSPEAIDRLTQIVLNGSDNDAVRACEAILNRAWGRPQPESDQKEQGRFQFYGDSQRQIPRQIPQAERHSTGSGPSTHPRSSVKNSGLRQWKPGQSENPGGRPRGEAK
jgi:hypothetical protein